MSARVLDLVNPKYPEWRGAALRLRHRQVRASLPRSCYSYRRPMPTAQRLDLTCLMVWSVYGQLALQCRCVPRRSPDRPRDRRHRALGLGGHIFSGHHFRQAVYLDAEYRRPQPLPGVALHQRLLRQTEAARRRSS